MAERNCDVCGKKKSVEGGKTCENGHFICKNCVYETQGLFSGPRKQCPLDKKTLR